MPAQLSLGDCVRLFGGYEPEPRWLQGNKSYLGTISAFIPGQNQEPATVVQLEKPISFDDATGTILVLELRYVGKKWEESGTVHIELCDFVPEAKSWQQRRQGKWIESHANYQRI
jgi:hypothetical protein